MDTSVEAQHLIMRLMDGYVRTQLLYVAAVLDIAGSLANGPRTSTELASIAGADPSALHRVLRGLAVEGVVEELDGGRFGLTAAGTLLRDDVPGSARGAVLARGGLYYRAAAGLLDAVRRGGSAFQQVHGHSFFEHLGRHPEEAAAFQGSMAMRSAREAADVVAAYDFGRFHRLIDVGGGLGILLTSILQTYPHLRGTLLDRPDAVEQARRRFEAANLSDRCNAVGGDFFAELPTGGDGYLLSRVLHDWDNDAAGRILANCRRAIAEDGTLLLVEAILPECAQENPAAIAMDINMLILLDGHERTEADYRSLLTAAGFTLSRVISTSSAVVSVIEATPA